MVSVSSCGPYHYCCDEAAYDEPMFESHAMRSGQRTNAPIINKLRVRPAEDVQETLRLFERLSALQGNT